MLACTELITMCLQSAKQKHLRAQQQQQQQQPLHGDGQGLTIFHDAVRTAALWEAALTFSELAVNDALSSLDTGAAEDTAKHQTSLTVLYPLYAESSREIFRRADKNDYFSQHLGEYLNVLSALESLNVAILKAMDKTKEEYQGSSVLGQFVTRFMLRETSGQLLSLQRSLQCAMEAVGEQSSPAPREAEAPELTAVQRNGRRCGRRVHNNLCMSPSDPCFRILTTGVSTEGGENWCSQINRLQQLLDKLDCQSPKLEPLKEDTLASTYKSNILLVHRQMAVTDKDLDNFRKVLQSYVDAATAHADNLHYLQSNSSKDFQRCIIDMLEDAEVVSTMLLPASSPSRAKNAMQSRRQKKLYACPDVDLQYRKRHGRHLLVTPSSFLAEGMENAVTMGFHCQGVSGDFLRMLFGSCSNHFTLLHFIATRHQDVGSSRGWSILMETLRRWRIRRATPEHRPTRPTTWNKCQNEAATTSTTTTSLTEILLRSPDATAVTFTSALRRCPDDQRRKTQTTLTG
ncbi:hypothetical protein F2P81_012298 [Scophthalmus maximus]|uniref:Uncharacterized protein n=1 Tax=Scophthalmus maximus TaxID=52904 RepID=A0A6A4SRL0_SCOMX|nr:hypothetical protein F2P81_012298 [Scophthalmus maximus]